MGRDRPTPISDATSADPVLRGKSIALRLLAAHGWSVAAMQARLLRRGIPEAAAATVIADLTRAGLLSDAAFADETARLENARKPASEEFLRQKIESKGVRERTAAKAAAAAVEGVSELARAKALALRSVRPSKDPIAARRRVLGALLRRGFDPETAAAAADHVLGELPESDANTATDNHMVEDTHDNL